MMSKSEIKATLSRHKQTLTFEAAMYQGLKFTDKDIDKDIDTTTKAEEDEGAILVCGNKICA